ncbi:MAG: hypothetical protein GY810_17940 [Aureispira sp.]|nr:hypothetical protein [Aureispira sp.]
MKEEEKLEYKESEYPQEYQEQGEKKVAKYSLQNINEEVKAELEEQLEELEMVRKRYHTSCQFRMKSSIFFVALFVLTILTMILFSGNTFPMWGFVVAITSFIFLVFTSLTMPKVQKKYQHHFKYTVLERVVDLFFADLRYTPKRMIQEAEFKESKIGETFQAKYKNYKGEDYFEGTYKGYSIRFSEAATMYTKKTVVKKTGETNVTYTKEPLFSGLLFVVDVPNTSFASDFWAIVPTQKGNKLEDLYVDHEHLQQMLLGKGGANIPQKSFDYQFQKDSKDVSPQLVNKIAELSQELEEPIWVSYNKGKLYIGVSTMQQRVKTIYEHLNKKGFWKMAMEINQFKDDIHYLFSPPELKVSVLDNKNVILKPLQEIQSCLDIVDNVLTVFGDNENE